MKNKIISRKKQRGGMQLIQNIMYNRISLYAKSEIVNLCLDDQPNYVLIYRLFDRMGLLEKYRNYVTPPFTFGNDANGRRVVLELDFERIIMESGMSDLISIYLYKVYKRELYDYVYNPLIIYLKNTQDLVININLLDGDVLQINLNKLRFKNYAGYHNDIYDLVADEFKNDRDDNIVKRNLLGISEYTFELSYESQNGDLIIVPYGIEGIKDCYILQINELQLFFL